MRYFSCRGFGKIWLFAITVLLASLATHTSAAVGDAEPGFDPNVGATVLCTAVQADGKILIGGFFGVVDGAGRPYIARLNADGSLDASFSSPVNNNVYTIAVQPDGKILIGGLFTAVGAVQRFYIARLNADGSLDPAFNPSADLPVHTINVLADGKILLSGQFTYLSGFFTVQRIGRLNPDGSFDNSFSSSVDSSILCSTLQDDGKIIIGGSFTNVSGVSRPYLARLNASGGVDNSFNASAGPSVLSVAVQSDGRVIAAGSFDTVGRHHLARYSTTGTQDSSFNPFINGRVWSVALQTDGKIIVAGDFTTIDSIARNHIARLNADGTLDGTFNPSANPASSTVNCTSLQPDGKILVGGAFTNVGGANRMNFARLANDVATQSLTVSSASRVQWLRGGASPETHQVTFELSVNGGNTYTLLGAGTRINGGWERTGLALPSTGIVRARARVIGGGNDGGNGLSEAITTFAPEIAVMGNGVNIADGDTTPSITDYTDFGSVGVGDTLVRTFTITNAGSGFLAIGGVTVGGASAADFTVTGVPAVNVASRSSTTFSIRFAPSANGVRSAALSFTNSDATENPFNFSIQGTGLAAPEIAVFTGSTTNAGAALTDNVGTNVIATTVIGSNSAAQTFTIKNLGTANLTSLALTKAGANPSDFVIGSLVSTTLAPQATATFTVTFTPSAPGARNAVVNISSNDGDENPFNINVSGAGMATEASALIEASIAGDDIAATSANSPAAQAAANAIDNIVTNKYLNFDKLNSGMTITPTGKRPVQAFTLISAEDAPERDPSSFVIDGSDDGINFTRIASNAVPAFATRHFVRSVAFPNTNVFNVYRVLFPTVSNAVVANSVQIAELELLYHREITSPNDAVSITLPPGAVDVRGVSSLFDRQLDGVHKLEVAPITNSDTIVDIIPAAGATVIKGFELIGAADDFTFPQRRPSSVVVAGSNDGANYTNLATMTPATASANLQIQEFSAVSNTMAFARYRITLGPPIGGDRMQVGEMRLFGEISEVIPAPNLTVKSSGSNVLVSWTNYPGFNLETKTSLTDSNWDSVTNTSIPNNGVLTVTLPMTETSAFFRLRK